MGKSDIEIAVLRHRTARIRELRYRQVLHAAPVIPPEITNHMAQGTYNVVTKGNIVGFHALIPGNILTEITPQRNTILHLAAMYGHNELLELIVGHDQAHRDQMPNDYQSLLLRPNSNGDLPLHVAAAAGHAPAVIFLIEHLAHIPDEMGVLLADGTQVGVQDVWAVQNNEGNNALHLALKANHQAVALLLVNADQRVSFILNEEREPPLYMAAEIGNALLVG